MIARRVRHTYAHAECGALGITSRPAATGLACLCPWFCTSKLNTKCPKTDFKSNTPCKHSRLTIESTLESTVVTQLVERVTLLTTIAAPLRECKRYRSTLLPRMQWDRDAVCSGKSMSMMWTVGTARPAINSNQTASNNTCPAWSAGVCFKE